MADLERGQRIKGRREELHLTQPAVVEAIEGLAKALPEDHDLHPANAGKSPVTLRGLQAWERGGGIVWEKAKLLAQALRMDVQTMMLGTPEPERTPDMFPPRPVEIAGIQANILEAIMQQLAMQTRVLQEIRVLLQREDDAASSLEAATERVDAAARSFERTAAQAGRVLRYGTQRRKPAAKAPAQKRKAPPAASTPESP